MWALRLLALSSVLNVLLLLIILLPSTAVVTLGMALGRGEYSTTTTPTPSPVSAEIIPPDVLCALCHSVVARFKLLLREDRGKLRSQLEENCVMLSQANRANGIGPSTSTASTSTASVERCQGAIGEFRLKRIAEGEATTLCVEEKLCSPGERPMAGGAQPPGISPLDGIPDVGGKEASVGDARTVPPPLPERFNDTNSHEPLTQQEYSLIAS